MLDYIKFSKTCICFLKMDSEKKSSSRVEEKMCLLSKTEFDCKGHSCVVALERRRGQLGVLIAVTIKF